MADLAEQQPDASIADAKREHDLDAKLKAAAERNRALREAKGQRDPKPLKDQIMSRWGSEIAKAIDSPPERILRIAPEEGDQPAVPDSFRRGMVPQRFASVTLDAYQPVTPSQRAALTATRSWLERALAGEGPMLALIGPQGTGKSHLLYAAANALLDAGHRPYARPWYRLADELRYGGEHPVTGREMDAAEVRAGLYTPKCVLLDEVRRTAGTEFDDMELTKLTCHVYDGRIPMFITTNVNPLADVMGPAAASRFNIVVIEGPDWRQR